MLVGGVGQLYQGDLDVGRLAVERLAVEDLGAGVVVEDLHYGAVAVAQRLDDLGPRTFVLVGAERRGRRPGTVERRRIRPVETGPDGLQAAIGDAVTGYVGLDLLIEVAQGLGALPERTVAVEIEPGCTEPSEALSQEVETALEQGLDLVRAEVRRAPLLELAAEIRSLLAEADADADSSAPGRQVIGELLDELELLDEEGRWGATFSCRDRLRLRMSLGDMDDTDGVEWALWWALIEELDRLQAAEA